MSAMAVEKSTGANVEKSVPVAAGAICSEREKTRFFLVAFGLHLGCMVAFGLQVFPKSENFSLYLEYFSRSQNVSETIKPPTK
ncbi:MAG: hypothetical protein E7585_07705 [Ruminococcaceae bacterium]|nr:hypothetical protein [Oscillospiraceae bacterium]